MTEPTMVPAAVHHVGLHGARPARRLAFYRDCAGLELRARAVSARTARHPIRRRAEDFATRRLPRAGECFLELFDYDDLERDAVERIRR